VATEQERVLEGRQTKGHESVSPEGNCYAGDRPRSVGVVCLVCLNNILLCTCNDGGYGEEERSKEETFTLVSDRSLEGTGELGEPKNHCAGDTEKEDQVEDEEDCANCDETRKGVRLDGDEGRDTTRGHGQCVPSPCEVAKPFTERKIWLIRVLLVRDLRMVVPASVAMAMAIIVLLLLEVNGRRWHNGI